MSSQRDQEYFCEGIAGELINALVKLKGLRVAARTSAFRFKDRGSDIKMIGHKLPANTYLVLSLAGSGRYDEAIEVMRRVEPLAGEHAYTLAAFGGETDKAVDHMEEAINDRNSMVIFSTTDPFLDRLQSNQRFQSLLKKIGL